VGGAWGGGGSDTGVASAPSARCDCARTFAGPGGGCGAPFHSPGRRASTATADSLAPWSEPNVTRGQSDVLLGPVGCRNREAGRPLSVSLCPVPPATRPHAQHNPMRNPKAKHTPPPTAARRVSSPGSATRYYGPSPRPIYYLPLQTHTTLPFISTSQSRALFKDVRDLDYRSRRFHVSSLFRFSIQGTCLTFLTLVVTLFKR
jgi:hypothetical protein